MKPFSVAVQMRALQQHFPVVVFASQYLSKQNVAIFKIRTCTLLSVIEG